ncbi:MAG: PorP/SprF family type IX secretion system membrane protein [Cyclobacteriaceae bacterium]|nr:PorP/SprF family type IX secretion system membrane protein [Cyclobacteriaceae bacterium]
MKRFCFWMLCMVLSYQVRSQESDFTQYYLNLPSVNPGFTGINEYMDVRSGVREGWNNFGIKNNNGYFSAYTALGNANRSGRKNNSLRTSNPTVFDAIQSDSKFRRRMGVGGVVIQRTVGPYKAFAVSANFAYHLPVSTRFSLALGTNAGYRNQRIDFSGLEVRDEVNDDFYNQLKTANQGTQNTLNMDFGVLLYSKRFYFGASSSNLVAEKLSGEFLFDMNEGTRYRVQTGAFLPLTDELALSPACMASFAEGYGLKWSATMRMRYKELLIVGAGLEPDSKVSVLLGLTTQTLSIGYAYDIYTSSLVNFNANTHEIVVGLTLFNKYRLTPRFW